MAAILKSPLGMGKSFQPMLIDAAKIPSLIGRPFEERRKVIKTYYEHNTNLRLASIIAALPASKINDQSLETLRRRTEALKPRLQLRDDPSHARYRRRDFLRGLAAFGVGAAALTAFEKKCLAQSAGGPGPIPPPFMPWATLTDPRFGGDPTNTNSCNAAFLAAEASFPGTAANSGVIVLPQTAGIGAYKVTGTGVQFARRGTSVLGLSGGSDVYAGSPGGPYNAPTTINAESMTASSIVTSIALRGQDYGGALPGNGSTSFFQGFTINLPVAGNYSGGNGTIPFYGTGGIYPGNSYGPGLFQDVAVNAGDIGIWLQGGAQVSVIHCEVQACGYAFTCAEGENTVDVFGSLFQNNALISILIFDGAGSIPQGIHIYQDTDEGGGNGSGFNSGMITFNDADGCTLSGGYVFTTTIPVLVIGGGNSGACNCVFSALQVEPYADNNRSPNPAIKIWGNSVNTTLRDIQTIPTSGTDIVDNGIGTRFENVNGLHTVRPTPARVTATITGTPGTSSKIVMAFTNTASVGNPLGTPFMPKNYTVNFTNTDTPTTIATAMVAAIMNDPQIRKAGIWASSSAGVVTVEQNTSAGAIITTTLATTVTNGGGGTVVSSLSNAGVFTNGTTAQLSDFNGIPSGTQGEGYYDNTDHRTYFIDPSGALRYYQAT